MRIDDFAPLYRSTVGFDRLFAMLDHAARVEPSTQWPPYDIEKVADDAYRITMAVAGFSQDEVELTQHDTTRLVTGHKQVGRRGRDADAWADGDHDPARPGRFLCIDGDVG